MRLRNRLIILILCLVGTDQLLKVIIYRYLFEPHVHIDIVKGLLSICPVFNTKMEIFGMPAPLAIYITCCVLLIGIYIFLFAYYNYLAQRYKWLNNCFLCFMVSASISTMIDKVFYPGTLDYIDIKIINTIFDLKDFYLYCGTLALLLFMPSCVYDVLRLNDANKKMVLGAFKWIKAGCPEEIDTMK